MASNQRQTSLLDRRVKVKIGPRPGHGLQQQYDAKGAPMPMAQELEISVRDAVIGGWMSDATVALQVFEQVDQAINS